MIRLYRASNGVSAVLLAAVLRASTHFSYLLAGLIPQARVKIYPDAAHGFLFQHYAEFA
jgi:hypothetical protein